MVCCNGWTCNSDTHYSLFSVVFVLPSTYGLPRVSLAPQPFVLKKTHSGVNCHVQSSNSIMNVSRNSLLYLIEVTLDC
jgi:hypothetical protein